MRFLFLLILPLFIFSQPIDRIVAVVGDEEILESEILQSMQMIVLQNKGVAPQTEEDYGSLYHTVLEDLIQTKVFAVRAQMDSLSITDEEIAQQSDFYIKDWIQTIGSESLLEQEFGMPLVQIKRQLEETLRQRLLTEKLQASFLRNVQVCRTEVETFFYEYEDSLPLKPSALHISYVLCENKTDADQNLIAFEKAKKVLSLAQSGENFENLAQQFSDHAETATNGGDLGWVERGDFPSSFENVAFALSPGEISPVVETSYGFHILKLTERKENRVHLKHIFLATSAFDFETEHSAVSIVDSIAIKINSGDLSFENIALDNALCFLSIHDLGTIPEDQIANPSFWVARRGSDFQAISRHFSDTSKNLETGHCSKTFKVRDGAFFVYLHSKTPARKYNLTSDWATIETFALRYKQERLFGLWVNSIQKDVYIQRFD